MIFGAGGAACRARRGCVWRRVRARRTGKTYGQGGGKIFSESHCQRAGSVLYCKRKRYQAGKCMKKFLCLLLSVLLALGCAAFSACDRTPPGDDTGGIVQPGDPGGPGETDPDDTDPDGPGDTDPDETDPDDPDDTDPDDTDPDDPAQPHEHSFGEWTVTVPATCTAMGEEQRVCACGETETRTVAALGHDYVNGVCIRCEDTITATDDSYFTFTELEDGTYSVALGLDPKILFEVVIPREHDGRPVTQIEDRAFMNCTGLTSITIPDSVISIGDLAFEGCMNLVNVTIGSGVTSIGVHAFYKCWWLTSITVSAGNPIYHSDENCLIETESKTLVVGCENSIIPDDGSVTSIGKYAFSCCLGLASITIGSGVTSVGERAFMNCDSLTSIIIPDSVTSVGEGAFYNCGSLTSVTFANADGWSAGGAAIPAADLADPAAAAEYLKDAYCWDVWTRA